MDHFLVEKRFLKARATYDDHAQVQKIMALDLISNLKGLKDNLSILEIGCGTGFFTNLLLDLKPKQLVLNDLSYELCEETLQKVRAKVPTIDCHIQEGNMDKIAFKGQFNLICANAVLQWSVNLEALLHKLKAHLQTGGIIAFTTFLPGTLKELTKAGAQGLDYVSCESLKNFCHNLGFKLLVDEKEEVLEFKDARCALKHLSLTGVSAIKRKLWTKGELKDLMQNLQSQSIKPHAVLLSFKTLTVIATLQDETRS